MPAVIYFVNVSMFELRIVFYILRNNFLVNFDDPVMVRRVVYRFYIVYCKWKVIKIDILLYITVIFYYEIFFFKPLLFFVILITWIPQIVRYAQFCQGTVNILTVIILSANKIFIPVIITYLIQLYLWKCPNNFMQIRPNDIFSHIISLAMLTQVIFMKNVDSCFTYANNVWTTFYHSSFFTQEGVQLFSHFGRTSNWGLQCWECKNKLRLILANLSNLFKHSFDTSKSRKWPKLQWKCF